MAEPAPRSLFEAFSFKYLEEDDEAFGVVSPVAPGKGRANEGRS